MLNNITFTMIKPDAVADGHIGAILNKISEAGFRISAMKLTQLTVDDAKKFYEIHSERPFYDELVAFMSSGPIVAAVLEKEKAELESQSIDYYERLQRQQAEFDNYRKRTIKEKEELIKYASERILVSMLPIVDNFERAISAAQTNQDFNAFAQGVELIFRQVLGTLDKEGLKPIVAVGQPFDPNLHEAVMQVDSEEYEENTVVEELQKGYLLKEKVIRPSMVKVAR